MVYLFQVNINPILYKNQLRVYCFQYFSNGDKIKRKKKEEKNIEKSVSNKDKAIP